MPTTRERDWEQMAATVAGFRLANGHLPAAATGCDDAERAMYRWLRTQRELHRQGRLNSAKVEWLDLYLHGWSAPLEDNWKNSAIAVTRYRLDHGRLPQANAKDECTRRLGMWVRTQRRADQAGKLSAARKAWLDSKLPTWNDPAADAWYSKADVAIATMRRLGRNPDPSSTDRAERDAAQWFRAQRSAHRNGGLNSDRVQYLEALSPKWHDEALFTWFARSQSVQQFFTTTGTLPRSTCESAEERRLGIWLTKQRSTVASKGMPLDLIDWLDANIPGWQSPQTNTWLVRAADVVAFQNQHGRLPERRTSSIPGEPELAAWLSTQRAARHTGILQVDRKDWLDANLPKWSERKHYRWVEDAESVARFEKEFGRLPGVLEPDQEGRRLGMWLSRQRRAAKEGRLSPTRHKWLERNLTEWQSPYFNVWLSTAAKVEEFVAIHGRFPTRSRTAGADERELGIWLNNQRTAHKTGKLPDERREWLDARLREWVDPHFAQWLTSARAVAAFRRKSGRFPYFRSNDAVARRLGIWLNNQRSALKSGTLEDRRKQWLDTHLAGWSGVAATADSRHLIPSGAHAVGRTVEDLISSVSSIYSGRTPISA
ncbi:helicase associated domain-containing protein [Agromyces humi]|uniref:helicase associated domain-containing protein n=1 Tax=Agromyces humi TaxID=1766800 RepID=UPI0013586C0D|nr:helicase associated domain-containing protein [Agromyces humi]